MFKMFQRSPVKKLQKKYSDLLSKAFQAQRDGDIRRYSLLTAEAELLRETIEELKKAEAG